MEAFPNIKAYFKKCKDAVLKNGYIINNSIIKTRINFTAFKEYIRLKGEINQSFWEKWKYLKSLPDFELDPRYIKLKEKLTRKSKLEGRFERASYNYPVQSTAANMSKLAAIHVFNEIKSQNKLFKVLFPLMVHDQLVIECPIEESELWSKIVSESMVKAGNVFCKSVQIKAEPEILHKWKK
jgi:DNA polymerase I-like protein with 3'-5' exonuclease and polymerase domains